MLRRSATEVQVGTDPRWAVALTDLSAGAVRALTTLRPNDDLRTVRAACRAELVPDAEVDALCAHLTSAQLVVPGTASALSADRAVWSLLDPEGDGGRVLDRRERAHLRVSGLGRLGTGVATLLATAGIGALDLDDGAQVTARDIGLHGLTGRDVGSPRTRAAARALHDAAPTVRTRVLEGATAPDPGQWRGVDLVVLVEHHVADPVRYRALTAEGVPHLSVVVREASALVGPLVLPGRTACLGCVDHHRAERDPRWPAVAAQLATTVADGGEETTLALTAAALAGARAVAHVDGRPTGLDNASVEIRLPDVVPRRLAWPVHPDCDCGAATWSAAAAEPAAAAGPTVDEERQPAARTP